jgi:hypothetical protein
MMTQSNSGTDSEVLSGLVTDPNGNGVGNVSIMLYPYDRGADANPIETESNAAGEYSFDTLEDQDVMDKYVHNPSKSVIIATIGDWFSISSVDLETVSDLSFNINLKDQILRSPTTAYDGGIVSSGNPSLITCWRRIDQPGVQTLFLEVTDLFKSPVYSEQYEILEQNANDTLGSGTFLISNLRNDAHVKFSTQSNVGGDETPSARIKVIPAFEEHSELEKWHPIRTKFPIYDISDNHRLVSTIYSEPNENTEWGRVKEGIGLVASGLPMVGQALAIADLADFVIGGGDFDDSAEIGNIDVGFSNSAGEDNLEFPDPNTHINTTLSWSAERSGFALHKAGSVVMMIPLEFNEGVDTVEVTAQAEWLHFVSHVKFGQLFELSRFESITPDDPGDGPDEGSGDNSTQDADADERNSDRLGLGLGVGSGLTGLGGIGDILKRRLSGTKDTTDQDNSIDDSEE